MERLIKFFAMLWSMITGQKGSKEALGELVGDNKPGGLRSNMVKKGLKKEVSEMTQEEKTFHFAEKRFEWLISTGYNPRVHIAPDPKPDKPLSHYRATMLKIAKISSLRENLGKFMNSRMDPERKQNKYGIFMENYGL